MQEQIIHCCKLMDDFLEDKRIPIRYEPVFREYFMPLRASHAAQCFFYCPWCGIKLPKDLRDECLSILEQEYNIQPEQFFDKPETLPIEFQSDAWWKKRGL